MPELPEVEVVRRGLAEHVTGLRIEDVHVCHPRATRRHLAGSTDLIDRIRGQVIVAVRRRGKYLWLDLSESLDGQPHSVILVHLGMSGQMLLRPVGVPDETHLRIRATLAGGAGGDQLELRFVDQRTFGGWMLDEYAHGVGDQEVPRTIAHIAPDPFDPAYDHVRAVKVLRSKHSEIKRQLLDQTVVSGIGNIYADEALWMARLSGTRIADGISPAKLSEVLTAATEVMRSALAQGGTSFDALYVNVNGQSGYFERSLNVYGCEGQPCRRCGSLIRREPFMNRSSYSCPRCQRRRG